MFNRLLIWCGNHKPQIIRGFYLSYLMLAAIILFGIFAFSHDTTSWYLLARASRKFGDIGLLFFLAATVPGTLGRLGMRHPLITLGMMFRRQTGVSSFVWALVHGSFYLIPVLATHSRLFDGETYLVFGIAGLVVLALISLTSNDWAVVHLGRWWKNIQRLVYVVYWLVFLHVIFQRVSGWGLLIGAAAILEVISLVYGAIKARRMAGAIGGTSAP